jgi:hypothetical protein
MTALKKPLKLMEVLHLVKFVFVFVFVLVRMRVFCLQDDKVEKDNLRQVGSPFE